MRRPSTQNIESSRVSGKETFCFYETWRPEWGSTFQAGIFNYCTRAPAQQTFQQTQDVDPMLILHWLNVVDGEPM